MNSNLYIGLISGTSMDAVDCALVEFNSKSFTLIDFINIDIPPTLKTKLLELCDSGVNQIQSLGETDIEIARLFSRAVLEILEQNQISPKQIRAIGSHGQTIRHCPILSGTSSSLSPASLSLAAPTPFTLQIGDPNTIAYETGITTVADFRRKDMAAGGQGAPLVPAFHQETFSSDEHDRVILNIGGMSNITVLTKNKIVGFDTGPGNVLMDIWIQQNQQKDFDFNGEWAAEGQCNNDLLQYLLQEKYFQLAYPKSTGRELFNQQWLKGKLRDFKEKLAPCDELPSCDIQATLLSLTSTSICQSIASILSSGEVIVCGGGARNGQLINALKQQLAEFIVTTSTNQGLDGDSIEAIAFAWFAKQAIEKKPVNLCQITGASREIIMGGIYYTEQ